MANIKQIKVGSTAYDIKDSNANIAYGTCSTDAATAAKVVTINNSNWELKEGSVVIVLFSATNTAENPTLNVGGTGAKNIYYQGSKITSDIIKAGDTVTFVYNTNYHLISVDRWHKDIESKSSVTIKRWEEAN